MEGPSPDNEACCEDPFWRSEAYFDQLNKESEEMSGLIPDTPLLSDEMSSAIAKALKIDDSAFRIMISAVYHEMMRTKISYRVAQNILGSFPVLRRVCNTLAEVVEELRGASPELHKLLDLAYSSTGERGMSYGLQGLIDPLMPLEWHVAHCEERLDGISPDHALEMIEAVRSPLLMLLEMEPRRSRGAPGRRSRNFLIRELAIAYQNTLNKAPTCTPGGRFMLLCQLMFEALGVDTKGLENAVQRVLRELKTD